MYDYQQKYAEYLQTFESYLHTYAENLKTVPPILGEAMRYSLLSGGKRIRPVLMLATAEVLGVEQELVLPYATALEMIHTYSLIHDDLPAMDNDDFRRGKPSCHKAYGEAYAILAGDALLNQALSLVLEMALKGEKYTLAAKLLSDFAGMNGMILGQVADMQHTASGEAITEKTLHFIQENKTGKLLLAPLLIPSILADNRYYIRLEQFGKELGRLFQITDDILDVEGEFDQIGKSVGKDENSDKLTCVKLYGLQGAKLRADECLARCRALLEGIDCNTDFLENLVLSVRERKA
ncbi:MAG: polyprenyl synthetase family protein [Clostridia bacterium]|nr:polyprenyl synthetase family protein [Clostridia bacterium]